MQKSSTCLAAAARVSLHLLHCLLYCLIAVGVSHAQSAASFNARNSRVSLDGGEPLRLLDDFTIEAWVYLSERPGSGDQAVIVDKSSSSAGYTLAVRSDGKLEFSYNHSIAFPRNRLISNASIPLFTWTHVTVTWDHAPTPSPIRGKLYLNGSLDKEEIFFNGVASSSNTMHIGGLPDITLGTIVITEVNAGLRGFLDELKIWNVVRSAAQVAGDRFDDCLLPSSLLLYYKFNQDVQPLPNEVSSNYTGFRTNVNIEIPIFPAPGSAQTLYVDGSVAASGGGTSWGTAFKTLDEALAVAHGRCAAAMSINIAAGTYKPTQKPFNGTSEISTSDSRDRAFHIRRDNLSLYGGFPNGGGPTANPTANPTILSGDFNGDDASSGSGASLALTGNSENAYHVLLSTAFNTGADGITFRGGNAIGLGSVSIGGNTILQYSGGGAYGLAKATRCIFSHNQASEGGGLHDAGRLTEMTDCHFHSNLCGGQGAGAYLDSRPSGTTTLTNVTFTGNNTASSGGGLYCKGGLTRQLVGCIFSQNTAPNGAGLVAQNATQVNLQACVFSGNQAASNGGGLYSLNSAVQVANTLFVGNTATVHGGGAYSELGSISSANSTFFGNTAVVKGGGLYNAGNGSQLTNTIVWANTDDSNHGIFSASGFSLPATYSIVQGAAIYPGTGNSNSDPRFKTPLNPIGPDNLWRTDDDGLQLDCQSVAYNTGTNLVGGLTDLRGKNRQQFGTVDMGAYESDRALLPPTPGILGESVATGYLQKTASGGVSYLWSGGDTPNQNTTIFRLSGTYTVTVTNAEGCTNTASTTITVYPCPGATLYVDSSAVASGTGNSWVTAYKTLDEALVVAWRCPDVNRIEVAKGTYQASRLPYTPEGFPLNVFGTFITFHLRSGVALVGGFPSGGGAPNPAAQPTILRGNQGSVLLSIHDNANTRIEGFTIKFGVAAAFPDFLSIEGEPVNRLMGGGLLAVKSAIQVDNCTFSDNVSHRGGGVFHNFGAPRYTRCTFKNNRALKEGGAVYAYGATLDLTNCTIANNSTDSIAGGVHSYTATISLTNCTVANNADNGLRNFAGILTIKNSIVWGNAQGIVTQLGGNSTVSNSNIQGGHAGTDNVSIPPFFANEADLDGPDNRDRTADDGLGLTDLSMLINFGNPAGAPAQDITGASRGGAPDVGAYELFNACTGNTPRIFRVKADAGGANNGSTWNDAYTSLQTALEQACYGDQIWVAGGTYKPSAYPPNCTGCNTPRDHAFFVKNGVQLYGGFAGTENTLANRPSTLVSTVLSGDIGTSNDSTDNCHHVVLGLYNWKTTRLDGFTVRGGLANGFTLQQETVIDETGFPEIITTQVPRTISVNTLMVDQGSGGGLSLGQSWMALENLTVEHNAARYNGGGLFLSSGGPTVRQSRLAANTAPMGGGAYMQNAAPDLFKVRFRGNRATVAVNQVENGGGGLLLNNCTGSMKNCFLDGNRGRGVVMDGNATTTLTNNAFADNGGGLWMFRASPTVYHCTFAESVYFVSSITNPPQPALYNCVIWSEEGTARMDHGTSSDRVLLLYSVVQGGYATGTNIVNADPKYFNQYDADGKDDLFGTADDGLAPDASGSAFDWGAGGETKDITDATRTNAPDAGAYEAIVRCPANQTPKVIYVKWDATGADNGTSWANAYRSLYDAISSACPGDQVWAAAGTYKPTNGTERRISFKMRNGVAVYGGFVGTETALEQRNWRTNRCILSGNIGDPNLKTDNSLHVFRNIGVNNTAILDGFTIRDGYANLPGDPTGAGMYNLRSNPQILNCTFEANEAAFGAGMGNEAKSSPTISNCIFDGNDANIFVGNGAKAGAGMYNKDTSSPQILHSLFINNNSVIGGALYNTKDSRPYLANVVFANNYASAGGAVANIDVAEAYGANCTFYGNSADQGPAVYNSNYGFFTMVNGIFWDNNSEMYNAPAQGLTYEPNFRGSSQSYITHSIVKGGFTGTGNTTQDPLFVNATNPAGPDNQLRTPDDGLRLQGSSPAVNTGIVSSPPVPTDILGIFRDAQYDRGAYEVFCATTLYVDGSVNGSGDGTAWNKAFKTLDEALSATCAATTRINIAAGTYKPTLKPVDFSGVRITTADPRDVTFHLRPGVQLFGGYPAGGGIRDIAANLTLLSGDLNGDDAASGCGETLTLTGNGENAYHVVLLSYETPGGRSVLLDGLSVKGGNANGAGTVDLGGFNMLRSNGGGVYADYSYATLNQVTIQHNNASFYGGGVRAYASPLTMTRCAVVENVATEEGGGVNHYWIHEYDRSTFGQYTKFKMEDTRLECNRSKNGGALFSGTNHPLSVKRVLFRNNYASLFGGAGFLSNSSVSTAGTFAETVFEQNETKGLGGGALWITNVGGHTFENVVFSQNKSKDVAGAGGAVYLEPSSFSNDITRFHNCTFYNNQSKFYGGGMTTVGGQVNLLNTVFYQNIGDLGGPDIHNRDNFTTLNIGHSSLQLANSGAYNTGAFNSFNATGGMLYGQTPAFSNPAVPAGADNTWLTSDDGLQLGFNAPLVNAGTTPAPPVPTDILGKTRQGAYDMGAYEVTCAPDAFQLSGGGPLCGGGSATVTLSGSQTGIHYQLRLNGANSGQSQPGTGNGLTFNVMTAGVYTVLASNTANGCAVAMTGSAMVGGNAAAVVVEETSGAFPNDGIVCPGSSAKLTATGGGTYLWNTGATTAAIEVTAGTYRVTVTDASGCQLLASATVTNHAAPTVFSLLNNNNGSITLSGSQSGATYQLQVRDVLFGGSPQNVGAPRNGTGGALVFTTSGGPGDYTIVATSATGCTAQMNGAVNVPPSPLQSGGNSTTLTVAENSGVAPNDGQICSGDPVTLTAPDGASDYVWSNSATTQSILVNPTSTTTYTVTYTGSLGQTSTSTTIVVSGSPTQFTACPTGTLTSNTSATACTASVTYNVAANEGDLIYSFSGATTNGGNGSGSGADFNKGMTTVSVTALSGCGTLATPCVFEVQVFDAQAPSIACPTGLLERFATPTTYSVQGAEFNPTFNDNCPGATIVNTLTNSSSLAGASLPLGSTTVYWTVTDGMGLSTSNCSFTVQVSALSITCPSGSPLARSTDATVCHYTVQGSEMDPSGYNNLMIFNDFNSISTLAGAVLPKGPTTIVWTVTASNGYTATCSFAVEVTDNEPPTITCPTPVSVDNATGQCNATVTYTAPVGSDNCPDAMTAQTGGLASGEIFPVGTTANTFQVTAANGQTATCAFTVTVTDAEPPSISCLPNINLDNTLGQCGANFPYTPPVGSDNCPGATTAQTTGVAPGMAFPLGATITTFQVTAANGQTATCAFTLTVADTQVPSIVCPSNITRANDPGQCTAVVSYSPPTVSDNCGAPTLTRTGGLASGSVFPHGTNMVEWKTTDAAGLSSVCQFTVTVADSQVPVVTCPANVVRSTDAGLCTATVIYATPTATDNCGTVAAAYVSGGESGTTFLKGTKTVVWKATDSASPTNIVTCSFTITVNDTQRPNITCPANQTVGNAPGACSATVNYAAPQMTDNCTGGSATIHSGLASGSVFPKGQTTVTWRATDAVGLTKTCTFRVTVNDTEAPTITCPSSQSLNTDAGLCSAMATYTTPTAADNCTPPPTVVKTSGLASGSNFPKGTNTVVWRATDGAGLTKTCSFAVTVTDVAPPSITCPGDVSVTAPAGQCSIPVMYTTPTATDNCNVQSVFLLSGLASGSTFPQGLTTNVWRAVDNSGGSSTCAFTVTVSCGTNSKSGRDNTESRSIQPGPQSRHFMFHLSPNPAITEVQVSIEEPCSGIEALASGSELLVFDPLGRVLLRKVLAAGQRTVKLDVSGPEFVAGLYQVGLRTECGMVVKALVVSRL